jgi:uncharacterized protein (TIGR02001 family)
MKFFKLTLLAAAATVSMGGAALAQDETGPSVSFNIGAATDYVFRGFSQTDGTKFANGAQVFGGADVTVDKFYAGVWASNVDFNDSTDAEVDVYAGFKPTLGPVALDIAAIYYGYIDAPSGSDYGYFEGKVAGSVPVGKGTLGAAFYYSPDFFGPTDGDDAYYYEANASFAVTDKLSISGAVGRQEITKTTADYTTWNLGLGYAINEHIGVDVRYWDTDENTPLSDSRGVVSLKATF